MLRMSDRDHKKKGNSMFSEVKFSLLAELNFPLFTCAHSEIVSSELIGYASLLIVNNWRSLSEYDNGAHNSVFNSTSIDFGSVSPNLPELMSCDELCKFILSA